MERKQRWGLTGATGSVTNNKRAPAKQTYSIQQSDRLRCAALDHSQKIILALRQKYANNKVRLAWNRNTITHGAAYKFVYTRCRFILFLYLNSAPVNWKRTWSHFSSGQANTSCNILDSMHSVTQWRSANEEFNSLRQQTCLSFHTNALSPLHHWAKINTSGTIFWTNFHGTFT